MMTYVQSPLLCISNNTQRGAILHATTRVLELSLAYDIAACLL